MSTQQNNMEWSPSDWYDPDLQNGSWDINVSPHTVRLDENGNVIYAEGGPFPERRGEWYALKLEGTNMRSETLQVELAGSYFQGVGIDTIPAMHEGSYLLNRFSNELLVRPRVTYGGQGRIIMYVTNMVSREDCMKPITFMAPSYASDSSDSESSSSEWTPSHPATEWYDPSIRPTASLPANWKIKFIPDTIYLNPYGEPIAAEGGPLPSCENSWYEVAVDSDDLYGNTVELRGSYSDHNMIAEMDPPFHEHFLLNKVPNTIKLRTIPKTPIEFPEEGGDMNMWDAQKYWDGPVRGGIHFIYSEPFDSSSSEWFDSSSSEWTPSYPATEWYDPSIRPTASLDDNWSIYLYHSYVHVDGSGEPTITNDNFWGSPSYQNGWCDIELLGNLQGNTVELMLTPSHFNGLEIETIPPLDTLFPINKFPSSIKAKAKVLAWGGEGQINLSVPPNYSPAFLDALKFVHDPSDSSSWEWTPSDSSETQWYDPSIQPTASLPDYWGIRVRPHTVYVDVNGCPVSAEGGAIPSCENGWYELNVDSRNLHGNTVSMILTPSYLEGIELETNPELETAFAINKIPNTIKVRPRVLAYDGTAQVDFSPADQLDNHFDVLRFIYDSEAERGWFFELSPYRVDINGANMPMRADGGDIPVVENGWHIIKLYADHILNEVVSAQLLIESHGMTVQTNPAPQSWFSITETPIELKIRPEVQKEGGFCNVVLNVEYRDENNILKTAAKSVRFNHVGVLSSDSGYSYPDYNGPGAGSSSSSNSPSLGNPGESDSESSSSSFSNSAPQCYENAMVVRRAQHPAKSTKKSDLKNALGGKTDGDAVRDVLDDAAKEGDGDLYEHPSPDDGNETSSPSSALAPIKNLQDVEIIYAYRCCADGPDAPWEFGAEKVEGYWWDFENQSGLARLNEKITEKKNEIHTKIKTICNCN